MKKIKIQAFTLIELIVVITILAILWTIAFISLQWYNAQSRDSRRISDIQNIKKSLELFSLNSWKFPEPDDKYIISYWPQVFRYQWVVWEQVSTNLSRNLNKKPTDPLTESEYIYSRTYAGTEYELLSIYESYLISSNVGTNLEFVEQSYAAPSSGANFPKINGNYNGVYIKAWTKYIPTPSLINSNVWENTDIFEKTTFLESQIVTWWKNNIANAWNEVSTWWLVWMTVELFDWEIDIDIGEDDNNNKTLLAQAFIDAYSWTILTSEGIYKQIVETSTGDYINLVDTFVLSNYSFTNNTMSITTPVNWVCGTDNWWDFTSLPTNLCTFWTSSTVIDNWEWSIYEWTCVWINWWDTSICSANHIFIVPVTTYPWCSEPDIQIWGYSISSCNVWTNTAWARWNYYQFGKSDNSWDYWSSSYGYDWKARGWTNWWSANDWWISDWERLVATYANQNSTDKAKMRWPCASWYHVPTKLEWVWVHNAWDWWNNWNSISAELRLPYAGNLDQATGNLVYSNRGMYWTSSPHLSYWFVFSIETDDISSNSVTNRAMGCSVRCFKNYTEIITPIDWTCWTDNWWDFTTQPTNLCSSWNASAVIDNWEWSSYEWLCSWFYWWTTENCSANHIVPPIIPINWECWVANWLNFSIQPASLCSEWIASSVIDNWEWSSFDWTCLWIDWWTNVTCSANHIASITTYPWCNELDIVMWDYIISSCNVWSTIAWTSSSSYWNYYQFGKSDTSWVNWNWEYAYDWKSPGWTDAWSANDWWISESERTTATYANQDSTDQVLMQWPCASWYHIPTALEWAVLHILWWWENDWNNIQVSLKLPYAGYRDQVDGGMMYVATGGRYWSSSPNGSYWHFLDFNSSNISSNTISNRAMGFSVRCFKN